MQAKLWFGAALGALSLLAGLAGPAQAQQKTLTIGVLTDMSNVAADDMGPGSVLAAQMAVEDAGGTVAGMKINVLAGDHQQKPDVGVAVTRRWIDQEHVNAIVDVPNASVALAINNIARDANIVFMPSSASGNDLTGSQCSPNTVRWVQDTYSAAHTIPTAMMKDGAAKNWFIVRPDSASGKDLQAGLTNVIGGLGGKVVGSVSHPVGTTDFSSYLLQAKVSKADVVGIGSFSNDLTNALKASSEFQVMKSQKVVGFILDINNIKAIGLNLAQGLYASAPFYWDMNDQTRAFAKRFDARHPKHISVNEYTAGVYANVRHYLKAVAAIGPDKATDGRAVVAEMKQLPVDDPLYGKGQVRADGSVVHNMYLLQAKTPAQSKGDWDYFNVIQTIDGETAFGPVDKACSLVTASK